MKYEQVWYAWTALIVLVFGLAVATVRGGHPLAKNGLLFLAGFVFGQICLLVFVGIPRVISLAFTVGATEDAARIAYLLSYAIGATALFLIGRLCATNPLIPVTWPFVAGAASTNLIGIATTVLSFGNQQPAAAITSIALSLMLAAALVAGWVVGRWRSGAAGASGERQEGRIAEVGSIRRSPRA